MRSIQIVILIILAACLLPYVFAFIARIKSGYQTKMSGTLTIREHLALQTGLAARANAAQQNSFEGLPLFLVAMLMAQYLVIPDRYAIFLGLLYLFFRIIYGVCYLFNFPRLRSLFWILATLCPIDLLIICFRII